MIEAFRHLSTILAGIFRAHATAELDTADDSPPPEQEPPDALLEPLTIGSDGLLRGAKVEHIITKRGGYKWRTRDGQPGGILTHWTSTSHGTARSMVKRTQEGSGSSVHVWIESDGTIFQQVPFVRGAGHAGGKTSARLRESPIDGAVIRDPRGSYSANSFLLGCEVVNVGEVRRMVKVAADEWAAATGGDPKAVWMGWPYGKGGKKGSIVKAEQVVECMDSQGRMRHYQAFTAAQLEAIERLITAGVAKYGWSRSDCCWGHVDVDGGRKSDPGPFFRTVQLPAILDRVFGDAAEKAA